MPSTWVATTGNLVFSRQHDKVRPHCFDIPALLHRSLSPNADVNVQGGHFAALEQPELLKGDLEEFVGQVWKR